MPDHLVHLTDERLRVCLERTVELDNVRLKLRDWPGYSGPLIHVPDPFSESTVIGRVAAALAPRYRVMSLAPRRGVAYQVSTADLVGTLEQFGFSPILIGEGLGCLTALLAAAWFPRTVRGLILVDPSYESPSDESIEARALRDCPPDGPSLRAAVTCPVTELDSGTGRLTDDIDAFAAGLT